MGRNGDDLYEENKGINRTGIAEAKKKKETDEAEAGNHAGIGVGIDCGNVGDDGVFEYGVR